jgi:iron uptake system component EfeO
MYSTAAKFVLGASLLLGGVHPVYAQTAQHTPPVVHVTLTNDGCVASPTSGVAGPVTFLVTDTTGDQVSEVELISNGLIVGEKENLFPGASGQFSVNLPAGSYALYCPGATAENTPFIVAPAPGGQPTIAVDPQLKLMLDQAALDYRAYVQGEVAQMVSSTQAFTAAVQANDLNSAKQLYPAARTHYEAIEPVAESFGDLDPAIDMREDDADDPSEFTGFHRLEKAIWQDGSLEGMAPIAQQLMSDTLQLQSLVNDPAKFSFDAAQIANGSTELLDEVAQSKITGEEERYSGIDLLDMAANIQGSRKGYDLVRPGLGQLDGALASTIDQRFAALDAAMQPYQVDGTWVTYKQLGQDDIRRLSEAVNNLAEPLSQVAARIVIATGGTLGAEAQPGN